MVWGGLFGRLLGMMIQNNMANYPAFHVAPGMYALLGMYQEMIYKKEHFQL